MMKSKISFVLISLFLYLQTGTAQTISITFSGLHNEQVVHLEKIRIENMDKSCDTMLYYPDSILVLHSLGVDDPVKNPDRLTVFQNTPNPVTDQTFIKLFNPISENLTIVVREIGGKPVCAYEAILDRGYHLFEFSPGKGGTFIFSVSAEGSTASIKVLSSGTEGNGISRLRYSGKSGSDYHPKETMSPAFVFSTGDHLRYTCHYLSMASTLEDTPQNDKTYTFEFASPGFICGQNVTINHITSGGVAPVNKSTTYGTVTNIPGEPSKCWITSNLGSDHQATAVDDSTEVSAGWYWQFNRKQGYQHDGLIRTPNTLWNSNILDNSDWLITNDPCNIEMGTVWRMPTYSEWRNVDEAGGWVTWSGAWNSDLKLHAAGELSPESGALRARGVYGFYWSNYQRDVESSWGLYFHNDYSDMNINTKPYANSIRCLRDTCSTIPALPTSGIHVPSPTEMIWNWEPLPGATGYKWSDSRDYYLATDMGNVTSKTETGLHCYSSYTRYVWAYNACNNYSIPLTMTAATTPCPWACGDSLQINHIAGAVAPVTKTTTYGTVTNIPGATSKCWISSNLGADHQATAVNDATEAAAGWYWQFNRVQGYMNDGTTVSPSWTISSINENSDWLMANDPCAVSLEDGWRLPTGTEWSNVQQSNGWISWGGPWSSPLKLHAAGGLDNIDGSLFLRGSSGYYWSSVQNGSTFGSFLILGVGICKLISLDKAYGYSVRCLRDN